jgi:hypothetical protein
MANVHEHLKILDSQNEHALLANLNFCTIHEHSPKTKMDRTKQREKRERERERDLKRDSETPKLLSPTPFLFYWKNGKTKS